MADKGAAARLPRTVSRVMTLVVAVGFAVVGIAGAASAHHNTITGTVDCKAGGGWAVTWTVVNSESTRAETITASNRPWAVPVGTQIGAGQTGTYTETVTTKPAATVELKLTGRWKGSDYDVSQTNSGSIPVAEFEDGCNVTTVQPPTVPVIDECGPGNAHYGQVPSGPWTSTPHPDGSLTVTADPGYQFPNGQTSITYPVPTDSDHPCPPTVVQPPTVPVVDECGPGNAHYGQVPSGPWTSTPHPDGSLTVTADSGYQFPDGQTSITYPVPTDSNQPCPTPPVVTPPVLTPPVATPPEVLPAQVRVVSANARKIDKCGRASDMFKVAKSRGVVYRANGKVVREGAWIKAKRLTVTVRARPADPTFRLRGKQVWRMTFTAKACAQAPQVAPHTGAR